MSRLSLASCEEKTTRVVAVGEDSRLVCEGWEEVGRGCQGPGGATVAGVM